MGLRLPSLPSLPSLPKKKHAFPKRSKRIRTFQNHLKRSQTPPNAPQTLPDDPKRFQNFPKHSPKCHYAYTYLHTIHTYGIMLPSISGLATAPIRPNSARNAFKRLQNAQAAPKRSHILFTIMLTCITSHTIPYRIELCLPYHHRQHRQHTYGIGPATCIKCCM